MAEFAANDGQRLRDLHVALAGRQPPAGARAVRIDRFGLVLVVPDRPRSPHQLRLDFPSPITNRRQLRHLAQVARAKPGTPSP